MSAEIEPIEYRIDRERRLIEVAGPWGEFARANGGVGLSWEEIEGRPIEDFISGDVTRMWFGALIQLATLRGEVLQRPYRCDSPGLRRNMEMRVTPAADGTVLFQHRVVSIEPCRARVHFSVVAPGQAATVYDRCSACGRIRAGNAWLDLAGPGPVSSWWVQVVYTVCEECAGREASGWARPMAARAAA